MTKKQKICEICEEKQNISYKTLEFNRICIDCLFKFLGYVHKIKRVN